MNKKFLVFLILLTPIFLFAQSNFMKGDVVTNNGDTVRGFINYVEWYRNPDKIEFRYKKEDINSHTFSVENTQWFKVEGYESYEPVLSIPNAVGIG